MQKTLLRQKEAQHFQSQNDQAKMLCINNSEVEIPLWRCLHKFCWCIRGRQWSKVGWWLCPSLSDKMAPACSADHSTNESSFCAEVRQFNICSWLFLKLYWHVTLFLDPDMYLQLLAICNDLHSCFLSNKWIVLTIEHQKTVINALSNRPRAKVSDVSLFYSDSPIPQILIL